MALILTIENEESLPNGAPVSVRLAGQRSLDIGRAANLDWTLPDPSRFISGKHCEVRFRDEAYWLYDVSTNGTFLNDNARRLQAPHRLCHGDRLSIGSYTIAVSFEEEPKEDGLPSGHSSAAPVVPETDPSQTVDHLVAAPGAFAPPSQVWESDASIFTEDQSSETSEVGPDHNGQDLGSGQVHASETDLPPARLDEEEASVASRESAELPSSATGSDLTPEFPSEANEPVPEELREGQGISFLLSEPPPRADEAAAQMPSLDTSSFGIHQATDDPSAAAETHPPPQLNEFIARFAAGAGIPEQIFARQDGLKVAEELGVLMRMVVNDLTQLLSARFTAKRFARTSSQTMIQALDNNPLKFAPTVEDALKIMFGPKTSGYLDARRALEGGLSDLKTHQIKTFSAMQSAVKMLVEDLDPLELEKATGPDKGFSALLGMRKARLWDMYQARWQAKTLRHEDGLVDAFMLYFAECYDQPADAPKNQ
jgi:type VI secretion system protein ImpI